MGFEKLEVGAFEIFHGYFCCESFETGPQSRFGGNFLETKGFSKTCRLILSKEFNAIAKWCVFRWPHPTMSQQAGMSTEAFEDFYFKVCLLDYKCLQPSMNALKRLMKNTNEVQLKGLGADLIFLLKVSQPLFTERITIFLTEKCSLYPLRIR